jgi:predicted DNA-binding transcriptional regulator AlpA
MANEVVTLEEKRWLNPKELEERYGFSRSWQGKARMSGSGSSLPFSKIGSYIRYDALQISAWLEAHAVR